MKASFPLSPALLLAVLLCGCDFTVPLVENPKDTADLSLVGLWGSLKPDAEVDQLLVLPLDARELLISFPHGRGKENMLARCCLVTVGKLRLVQIKWLGTANGLPPDDQKVYQYASYETNGDSLILRMINPERTGKDHKTAASLEASILAARQDPALFHGRMVFHRIPHRP